MNAIEENISSLKQKK